MSTNSSGTDSLQNKLLSARNKLWTPELDRLLRNWKRQIGKRENGHNSLARKYNRRHYIFGLPAILLAAILSSGILSTFQNCSKCDENQGVVECEIVQYLRLVFGLLGIVNTALVGFQTFMNYQEEAEKNKSAADDYGALFRLLDSMILMPGPIRGDPITSLQNIRSRYDDLVRRSPSLPRKYNVDLSYNVNTNSMTQAPPPPPLINSNMGEISARARSDLKRIYETSDKSLNLSNVNSNKTTKDKKNQDDDEVTLEKELEEYPSNYMDNTCSNISPELSNQYILKSMLTSNLISQVDQKASSEIPTELSFSSDRYISPPLHSELSEEEVKDEEPEEEM